MNRLFLPALMLVVALSCSVRGHRAARANDSASSVPKDSQRALSKKAKSALKAFRTSLRREEKELSDAYKDANANGSRQAVSSIRRAESGFTLNMLIASNKLIDDLGDCLDDLEREDDTVPLEVDASAGSVVDRTVAKANQELASSSVRIGKRAAQAQRKSDAACDSFRVLRRSDELEPDIRLPPGLSPFPSVVDPDVHVSFVGATADGSIGYVFTIDPSAAAEFTVTVTDADGNSITAPCEPDGPVCDGTLDDPTLTGCYQFTVTARGDDVVERESVTICCPDEEREDDLGPFDTPCFDDPPDCDGDCTLDRDLEPTEVLGGRQVGAVAADGSAFEFDCSAADELGSRMQLCVAPADGTIAPGVYLIPGDAILVVRSRDEIFDSRLGGATGTVSVIDVAAQSDASAVEYVFSCSFQDEEAGKSTSLRGGGRLRLTAVDTSDD